MRAQPIHACPRTTVAIFWSVAELALHKSITLTHSFGSFTCGIASYTAMKILLLFAAITSVSFSATVDDEWEAWKSLYGKVYDDKAAESVRRLIWEHNREFVQQHNSEGHSYEVEMNEFADLVSFSFVWPADEVV